MLYVVGINITFVSGLGLPRVVDSRLPKPVGIQFAFGACDAQLSRVGSPPTWNFPK